LPIELDEPNGPPDWAVAERQLFDTASAAAGVFSQCFIQLISHKSRVPWKFQMPLGLTEFHR